MKRLVIILLLAILLAGCGAPVNSPQDKGLRVVTTVFPIYDFARAVGGDDIALKLLVDPGTEVHSFDPAPSDIRAIYDADLFFYIGGESDEWVSSLLSEDNSAAVSLIDKVSTLNEAEVGEESHKHHGHSHSEHETDEHIWTSPSNAAMMINTIAQSFSEKNPEKSELYKKNAEKYIAEINGISEEIAELVANTENPFLLVADRFPFIYFTEEYGISYEAAMGGCANSSDISLKAMRRLVEAASSNGVKAAYYTEMSGKSIATALSEETGVRLLELQSGHNVTLDEFESGITYADLLRKNLQALREGWS